MYLIVLMIALNIVINGNQLGNEVVEFTSSNLPIVIINTTGDSIGVTNRSVAEMKIIWNGDNNRNIITDLPSNYNGRIEIELHGQSSLEFPKKSFRIETQDSSGENLNISLLGLPKENDWILYAPYSDKSLMRNAIVYTIAGKISEYAPRVKYCELILDGSYNGLYVLTEKIKLDKNRINITRMLSDDINEPEVSGGYIFKKDKESEEDNVIMLKRGLQLIITEPKKNKIVDEQKIWLEDYLNSFEDVLYSNGNYEDYIDVGSFVDHFLIVEFAKNIDGYRRSTYFHKDRGGKIVASSVWDYNLSFGNADFNYGWNSAGWYYPVISGWDKNWWVKLIEDDTFYNLCINRWKELRLNQFNETKIISLIDDLLVLLLEAQERNFNRYPILSEYVSFNPGFPQSGSFGFNSPTTGGDMSWEEQIKYLKRFVLDRLQWIDSKFGVDIVGLQNNDHEGNTLFNIYQNYPNPYNSTTSFNYSIEALSNVNLSVYDINGRLVKTLVNEQKSAGDHSVTFYTSKLSSGTYIYKLKAGSFEMSRKMILLK